MAPEESDPLLLTARFDDTAQRIFQALRDRYFPARRNIVPAHLTLFHQLPPADIAGFDAAIAALCQLSQPMPFIGAGWHFLGNGVAVAVQAPPLCRMRQSLAAAWQPVLSAQDRQGFKPHVTIQNKVSAGAARATYQTLQASGLTVEGSIIGLTLWFYRGGPWQRYRDYAFGGAPQDGRRAGAAPP